MILFNIFRIASAMSVHFMVYLTILPPTTQRIVTAL